MIIYSYLRNFLRLFFPGLCVICKQALMEDETYFCLDCSVKFPKTNYHLIPDNPAMDRFTGKINLCKASSCLYYNKEGIASRIVVEIKYKGNPELGVWLGAYFAQILSRSNFFQGIDRIIPVPLHPLKQWKRGFNQAEKIASGIARVTGIPLEVKVLYRTKTNSTQTRKNLYERWLNTRDVFTIRN